MKYKVAYSKAAVRDLDRVWAEVYNASKSYEVTTRYMDGLMVAVEEKADYPKSGVPLYYEDIFTGYYFVIFKAYMAFYRLEGRSMFVDRVLFGKNDYLRELFIN
jgi:Plasmid stabilization system protein